MRALKSVLVTAGGLKRTAPPSESEAGVLIRAMRESVAPKLLPEDLVLFDAILGDLFPGVELPDKVMGWAWGWGGVAVHA
jgi:dynein heavy chain